MRVTLLPSVMRVVIRSAIWKNLDFFSAVLAATRKGRASPKYAMS